MFSRRHQPPSRSWFKRPARAWMRFSVPTPTAWADPHVRFTRANAHFAHMPVTPRWLERRVLRGASSSGCSAHASASLSRHRFCTAGSPWTRFRHARAGRVLGEKAVGLGGGSAVLLAELVRVSGRRHHLRSLPTNGRRARPPLRCRPGRRSLDPIAGTSRRRRCCTGSCGSIWRRFFRGRGDPRRGHGGRRRLPAVRGTRVPPVSRLRSALPRVRPAAMRGVRIRKTCGFFV